ncbi:MAG TPA: bifunctional alpha/beta hydrolase/OsmC family protein [Burkholderiales bacterium]|jgi:putative redox protein|nr:bifunctional alpha/beta hydrolase/OsmC family protein [Burkholderiales bacterium]
MASKAVSFPSSNGHALAGRLELPAGAARAWALFAHCFTCSKDSKAAAYISQALAARGIAVLRFDFTGLGASGGDFAASTFSSNIEDLVAAAAFLRGDFSAPGILIGHSLGGAAVLAAAARIPEARAVATIGAPFEPRHVAHLVKDGMVDVGGKPFPVQEAFLKDLERQDPARTIATLGKALLVMHSPRDAVVGIDNAGKIFQAAKHPKSFLSLDDADHLLLRRDDASYAAEVLAAWSSRFLEKEAEASVPGVRVVEAGNGKFAQDIYAGRHRLRADEPLSAGGADSGPSPYDLLLAAVGACTAMTIRLYADQKKIPLERVAVELAHEKIHAADCADCETREGRVDRIERIVTLEGALDDAQRARLLEIANRCPVHRTLHSEVLIPTRLAERS